MNEFELIQSYFAHHHKNGDDAADITPPPKHRLVTSIDTSVAGRHFRPNTHPQAIGHKALAVSLSDIAAMGACPTGCLLSLTLPQIEHHWLEGFASGFHALANQFNVDLVGGDTTQGPLSISTVVFGTLPRSTSPLQRDGAQLGDLIVVSGQLGAAAHALHHPDCDQTPLHYPTPRVELGMALRGIASSCIDISDGLLQDLSHILKASNVGAEITADAVPLGGTLEEALSGGDDYELCFTASRHRENDIKSLSEQLNLPLTVIGRITAGNQLIVLDTQGAPMTIKQAGFQHF